MRFLSLGSGSKGNATLVAAGDTLLLLDCGFNCTEFESRLAARGLSATDIDAVLVTHEHGDHIGGVGAIARRWKIPVYCTHGTAASGRLGQVDQTVLIQPDQTFAVGDIAVTAVPVPHDAREPVQFVFEAAGARLGVLTDLGSVSPYVVRCFGGCDALLLEFNHDLDMLRAGPYPAALKRRVGGDWGHLNNQQAVALLERCDITRLHTLVVGHISEQNNTPDRAAEALNDCQAIVGVRVIYAHQGDGFDWLDCAQSLTSSTVLEASA